MALSPDWIRITREFTQIEKDEVRTYAIMTGLVPRKGNWIEYKCVIEYYDKGLMVEKYKKWTIKPQLN